MKIFKIFIVLLISIALFSCSKDSHEDISESVIEFSFQINHNDGRVLASDTAKYVLVSIINESGDLIYDLKKLQLFNFNGYLLSEKIHMFQGNYELIEYLVLNENHNIIYACPVEGSKYSDLVTDPLKIQFNTVSDQITKVVPEVISVAESEPNDFGYSTFSFNLKSTFNLQLAVSAFDEATHNLMLTSASLSVYNNFDSLLISYPLMDTTNLIKIPDGYDSYYLIIEKAGYAKYDSLFLDSDIKTFNDNPLKITLTEESKLTFPSEVSVNITNEGMTNGVLTLFTNKYRDKKRKFNLQALFKSCHSRSSNKCQFILP